MGAKIFLSHTFHVRSKYLRTHPKLLPAFQMVRLRVWLIFFLCIFYPKYFYYITYSLSLRERARSLVPALFYRRPWRTPPPVRKQAQTRSWVLGGSWNNWYRRIAGVSARRIEPSEPKKHNEIASKITFCPPARPADAHRIIVNKIRNELILSIKITSPDRNDRDRSRDARRSHLPLKLEPVEAGRLWRSWCQCFYCFWHVVMCELCFSWEEERDVVVLEAVGLWACNVQISTKDLVLKKCLRFALVFDELFRVVSYFSSDFEEYIRRNWYFFNKVYWEAVKI
jgi:hypothetical protein